MRITDPVTLRWARDLVLLVALFGSFLPLIVIGAWLCELRGEP